MHTLIVGERGVGKSTLIRRVLAELECPVVGFETKKETSLATEEKGSPVYIYDAGRPHTHTEENLLGWCKNKRFDSRVEVFDRYAPKLRAPIPAGSIVLLDELGFMESQAEEFCAAVMELLDGDVPVIAAVKYKDTPFLQAVRSHPKAKCFWIDKENRDALYEEVLPFAKQQIEENKEKNDG